MKKTIKILFTFTVCMMLCFSLSACKPKNIDKAKSRLEKAGYTVMDYEVEANAEDVVGAILASNFEKVNEIDGMIAILFENKSAAEKYYERLTENNEPSMVGEWKLDGKWVYAGTENALDAFFD